MRIGTNPLVETNLPPLPLHVAAMITHLPNRKGYHEKRFEVIQASLKSLRETADLPLYIWDNGSDRGFRQWLQKEIQPDFLVLSRNVGKATARTAILRTFPPETVVCLSDDDIYFDIGWLDAQLDLLHTFPNVGQVSGCPVRTQTRWGIDNTLAWARQYATLKTGRFISDEWDYDFCRSIGRDYMEHREESAKDVDYLIEYNGVSAYAAAHHMQFIGLAGRLSEITIWTTQAMRSEQAFDMAVDRAGLLRLTTVGRFIRHIGNVLEIEYA